MKTLDEKLSRIHADPHGCADFILADAKDADMALGLAAPGQSPESHAGEARFKTLEEYRDQIRAITRQGLVDIMLMSVSNFFRLGFEENLFAHSTVTPAIRANDTTDIHIARGAAYAQAPSRPFRSASLDHAQCGHLDCAPEERSRGANLGLYSVTFNNDPEHDLKTLQAFHAFREEAERKGFQYFLEVFDPNTPRDLNSEQVPAFINDMITRMLAGVAPAGRPRFLKIVYHGPRALEELVRFDPHLVVGVLGGSAGTTRDAFQLLADAKRHGARVALFGRKINNAENQLAFVQFLRLIADGQIDAAEAVKAYHAVLRVLGIAPQRPLEDDLRITTGSMSYDGARRTAARPVATVAPSGNQRTSSPKPHACRCDHAHDAPAGTDETSCACAAPDGAPKRAADERSARVDAANAAKAAPDRRHNGTDTPDQNRSRNVSRMPPAAPAPDFARMDAAERLAYHRKRLGLG